MLKQFEIKYEDITSVQNLLKAWEEFSSGKEKRDDVLEFKRNLMSNIFDLYDDLISKITSMGGIKPLIFQTLSLEISTKHLSETDFYTTLFTEFCTRILIRFFVRNHTRADWAKVLIKQ